jgi:hypothetical protein
MAFERHCGRCDCAAQVVGTPGDFWVCASHPDHAGRLTLVAAGDVTIEDAGARCRSFRGRRERGVAEDVPADDSVRYIDLGDGSFALVDAADFEWLNKYTWRTVGPGYASAQIGGKGVFMHRRIMNPAPGKVVDHINGNRKDNRRNNLRECTQAENRRNTRKLRGVSRFKGVSWNREVGKWQAKICHNGKSIHLGLFHDEVKAAKAYDKAARDLFGAFAFLNFPDLGNIVLLAGRIYVRSNARGGLRVSRRRNMPTASVGMTPGAGVWKFETGQYLARAFGALVDVGFGDCLGLPGRAPFGCRNSYFVLSRLASSRGPPGEKARRNRPCANVGWKVDRWAGYCRDRTRMEVETQNLASLQEPSK